jgi:hypothetical protein
MSINETTTEPSLPDEPEMEWPSLAEMKVLPMIQKALDRHRLDLPELMKTHPDQWVAYHGDQRLGFGRSQRKLYRKYLDRGLSIVNNVAASRHRAGVWLHRNRPGERDEIRDDRPFCLELNQGIVVYSEGSPNVPRLPILGLRGLKWTGLQLAIDGQDRRVGLRSPRRFWPFG